MGSAIDRQWCIPTSSISILPEFCNASLEANARIQCTPDNSVSSMYGVNNNANGYEWWFYDPHGNYHRRIFISHTTAATTTSYYSPTGALAATYLLPAALQTLPIPWADGAGPKQLNVRVRRIFNSGVPSDGKGFGPACRIRFDCNLSSNATYIVGDAFNPNYSCGTIDNADPIWVDPHLWSNKKQLRFVNNGVVTSKFATGLGNDQVISTAAPALSPGVPYTTSVRVSYNFGIGWCTFLPSFLSDHYEPVLWSCSSKF